MHGLHVDCRQDLTALFRFGLSAAAPRVMLERMEQVPTQGEFDFCLFRVPSTAHELVSLVAQLTWVAKPGAALFAYSSGCRSEEVQHMLKFLGCRGGANLEDASEVRQLWAEIAVHVAESEPREEAWSIRSCSNGLATSWQSVTRSTSVLD